jgi:uroporphyrinogen decarboxylase
MLPRERVVTALDHRQADRIPIDFWAEESVIRRLIDERKCSGKEDLLRQLGVDLRYHFGPRYVGRPLRTFDDGTTEDHWGVPRAWMKVQGVRRDGQPWSWEYKHVSQPPLAAMTSAAEIEAYPCWPTTAMWDYSQIAADCEALRRAGYAVVIGADRLDRAAQLKPAMYLRGAEQFLVDLMMEPATGECLLEHIVEYYLDHYERILRAAEGQIDIFFMGDDMGTQNGPWVSPDMYRHFFKSNFAKMNALAHRYGAKTMYHTCGNVTDLIPDFIDAGLDILQSLQPRAGMDLARIKKQYGRDLCFQGGIDIQDVMPKGTPVDVRAHVADRARIMAPGGGYIFGTAHNLLPDVPTENILALFEAYQEFGQYR